MFTQNADHIKKIWIPGISKRSPQVSESLDSSLLLLPQGLCSSMSAFLCWLKGGMGLRRRVAEGGWEFNESGRQKALANKPTAGHYRIGDTEIIQMACE